VEGFEHVLISGVLFGIALILVNLSLWGLNVYLDLAGVKLPEVSAVKVLNQTKGWWDFADNVQAALKIAEETYRSVAAECGPSWGRTPPRWWGSESLPGQPPSPWPL
jgi:hypothetical protein